MIAAAIGGIGVPEAQPCIDSLLQALQPVKKCAVDPQVKCMAVWAIGRLASLETIAKTRSQMLQSLQDPFYKVRATACGALVQFGDSPDCHSYDF